MAPVYEQLIREMRSKLQLARLGIRINVQREPTLDETRDMDLPGTDVDLPSRHPVNELHLARRDR